MELWKQGKSAATLLICPNLSKIGTVDFLEGAEKESPRLGRTCKHLTLNDLRHGWLTNSPGG